MCLDSLKRGKVERVKPSIILYYYNQPRKKYNIQSGYKLQEDFAKPYFHKY